MHTPRRCGHCIRSRDFDLLLLDRPPVADELLDRRHLGSSPVTRASLTARTHPCPAAVAERSLTPLRDGPVDTELCETCTQTTVQTRADRRTP